ncbi:MAG TPA: PepSY domain-containing protein [Puia sp.]|nr:PepSY domain-containing protein [Puia sp.]
MGLIKSNIYKWHRSFSLIIAIPVLLWAASGFMHPLMTNIRPKIATQGLTPFPIDSSRIRMPLQAALRLHHLDSISNFRLVHIDTNWFYQVLPANHHSSTPVPVYLSCLNGNALPAGDWLYAQYLARQFLEGAATPPAIKPSAHDCCGAATDCVLNPVKGAKVANVSLLREYDLEYKSINKLLPVYRVSFNRPDGIRIYVETTRDRFAFAMDDRRFIFDRIFTLVHTWAWLDFLGKGKLVVEFVLVAMAFLTTLMGIYIFFTTKSKKARGNERVKARRNHRFSAIIIALFTLMFTFSGAFHALSKFSDDTRDRFFVSPSFAPADLNFNFTQLQEDVGDPIIDIRIVSMYGHNYWQVTTQPSGGHLSGSRQPSSIMSGPATHSRDLMKDPQVIASPVTYISTDSPHSILPQGERIYAGFLAGAFSGQPEKDIQASVPILRFSSEYNFADKRLPVWKISYTTHDNERYYVETSTGRLSKRVTDRSLTEEYSFAFLHKHEFMGWGGKSVKDFSTMFWALAQVVMVVFGLILYFKYRS